MMIYSCPVLFCGGLGTQGFPVFQIIIIPLQDAFVLRCNVIKLRKDV